MPKITAHCLVKNEENWIWFSLMSVIDYVDEILVWDTGSSDRTIEIIKTISNPKLKFKQLAEVNAQQFTQLRQQMLEETKSGWVLILDGDEIWPGEVISQTIKIIEQESSNLEFLIHKYLNFVGDVYHFQDPKASQYQIGNYQNNVTVRAINLDKLPGVHFANPYGSEGFFDHQEHLIQNRQPFKAKLIEGPYLHATHLQRSSADNQVMQRRSKFKFEWGNSFSKDFVYPKSFYLPFPTLVPNPWQKRSLSYLLNASWQTPLKILKRKLVHE